MRRMNVWIICLGVGLTLASLTSTGLSQGVWFGSDGNGNVVGRPGYPMVKICPACDRTGRCTNSYCKGRGRWREGNALYVCSDCKGSGKCQRCNGTGRLN